MAVYPNMVLTQRGLSLYSKAQTGTILNFTRMQIGSGQLANGQDQTLLTALITPIAFFNINNMSNNANTASIKGIYDNSGLSASQYTCEIGLFAQDPTLGEILYAYTNAGASQGDTIPPIASGLLSKQFQINVAIGNATSVTVNVPAGSFILQSDKGAANGVAPLDNGSKLPTANLPAINHTTLTNIGTNTHAQIDTFISKGTRDDSTKTFIMEVRTSDPASPVVGQMWFRSDL